MSPRNPTTAERYAASGGAFTTKTHTSSYDYISPLKLNLTGQHVLVTGAALEDGVGFAAATAFARAGASAIAIADLKEIPSDRIAELKSAAREAGRSEPLVLTCTVDITQLESVQAMHKTVSEAFDGRLDILVNNAAHMEPVQRLLEADPDVYWRTWEVNVKGLFNMARTFLPMQLSSRESLGASCIMINLSSSGALSARPAGASYRSSKLALMRWTESLQLEYGDQGLLTFCVNPGSIRTQLSASIGEQARAGLRDEPNIAGDTIAWLAAERMEWLDGRYVSCPWDMEELVAKKDEIVEQEQLKLRMVF